MEEDEHILMAQLTSIKKKPFVSMRDFVANFNKITNRIPMGDRPTTRNLKTFFINVMPSDINFDLRRAHPTNLGVVQRMKMELEDDMISAGRWKCETQTKVSTNSPTSSQAEMIQKLSNEIIAMKRQLPKFNNPYQQNFQDQTGRNNEGRTLQLMGPQQRLAIEVYMYEMRPQQHTYVDMVIT